MSASRRPRQRGTDRALHPIWRALSDPTRRDILDRLRERPRTTGELASAFPTTRFAVMQHLEVLVEAGLVVWRRRGRERWNHLNAIPLQRLYARWVRPYEAHWAHGLSQLKDHVESRGGGAVSNATVDGNQLGVVELEMEVAIEAPREAVWAALVDEIDLWWPRDFFAQTGSQRMVLEARAGGRLYEESGDGAQLLWSSVVAVEPPTLIEFVGHLLPRFGGPATDMLRLALAASGTGTTLQLSETLYGLVSQRTVSSLKPGWERLYGEAFKRYAESRKRV